MRKPVLALSLIFALGMIACGSGSSDDGMLITGELSQGKALSHKAIFAKHSSSEALENVEVCALGKCSKTDIEGAWGFTLDKDFTGGDLKITVNGHGIDSNLTVEIPNGANDVEIDLVNEAGVVHAHSLVVDGKEMSVSDTHE